MHESNQKIQIEGLINKYAGKLVHDGLAEPAAPCIIAMTGGGPLRAGDAEVFPVLEHALGRLGINSLIYSPPAEPYRTIINYLSQTSEISGGIADEGGVLFRNLPVLQELTESGITAVLEKRKSVIIAGRGIIAAGRENLKQAYITYSSVCFACFVKFFIDYLRRWRRRGIEPAEKAAFERASGMLDSLPETPPLLMEGPFRSEDDILRAMEEAGKLIVDLRLVDSCFGNVSYRSGRHLFISGAGSFLDELQGSIVKCPLDGTTCADAPPPSRELPTHRQIVLTTEYRAVLHGHPRFSVILSMDCEDDNCTGREMCRKVCPRNRYIGDIPIVHGEPGEGPYGINLTVPPAIAGKPGVIVYGHGVFTGCGLDFNRALQNLLGIENMCRKKYFSRVR
ncbi:MAG: class II aldolase/adducin family protein [Syntrophales bacterium]